MIIRKWFPSLLWLGASLRLAPAAFAAEPVGTPNVVILLVDDMGFGDVTCFNPQSKIPTQHIDRLANEGMRFTDAHAPGSVCVPSRYGLLTGRMPYRTWISKGVRTQVRHGRTLPHFPSPMIAQDPGRLNLATLMKSQGYATACFGKWHQGMSRSAGADGQLRTTPVDFGFDYYFGFDAPEQPPYAFVENKHFTVAPTDAFKDHFGKDVTVPNMQGLHWFKGAAAPGWKFEEILPTIAQQVDRWLEKQSAKTPFFLYYAVPAPHAPWAAGEAFKGKSKVGPYGDYVMNVDAIIGQFMATLEKLKLKENTLIFFTSDNGPVWFPQDIARFDHRASGPWKGMKGALTEGGHHMPFVALWPGKIVAGSTCDALISFTDLMATLAALKGTKLPPEGGVDSFDISPLLHGEHPIPAIRSSMISPNYGSYNLAIRKDDWKLILPEWVYSVSDCKITPDHLVGATGKGGESEFALYNLKADPSESNNLAAQDPERVQELFSALKADVERGRSRP